MMDECRLGGEGVEPSRLSPYAPQTYVSASSTILPEPQGILPDAPRNRHAPGLKKALPVANHGGAPIEYTPMPSPEELNRSGMDFYKQGKFAEAVQAYEEAIAQRPDYAPCYINLSLALLKRGKPDDALHAAQRALDLSPQTGAVRYHFGNALLAKGRWNEAVTEYARAWELDKGQINALFLAGTLCMDHGVTAKAIELLKSFLVAAPPDHPKRGEAEESIRVMERGTTGISRY